MPTPTRHHIPTTPTYFLGRPTARYVERYRRRARPAPNEGAPPTGR